MSPFAAEMERQAQVYLKQKNWSQAIELLDGLLTDERLRNDVEKTVSFLTDRAECYLELNKHQAVIADSKDIIKLCPDQSDYNVCLARKRLIHSFYMLQRFTEADMAARDWLILIQESDVNKETKAALESLLASFINCTNAKQKNFNLLKILDANFTNGFNATAKTKPVRPTTPAISCVYCDLAFADKAELRAHCRTDAHQTAVMSDDGRDWRWRPPPRGLTCDAYMLCDNWRDARCCRYGVQCVRAHGEDELAEWRERFRYREMRMMRAKEKELFGKSYTEDILEKWSQSLHPESLMRCRIDEVDDRCDRPLSVTVSSKNSVHEWTYTLKTKRPLKAVALLQDTHRNHFFIGGIYVKNCKIDLKNNQEWISPSSTNQESMLSVRYRINVVFTTGIYGTFRQSIAFDFSSEPLLVKHMCVDVVPDPDLQKIHDIRKEITVSMAERWTSPGVDVVPYHSTVENDDANEEWEKRLRSMYPCPRAETFTLSRDTVSEPGFTKNNYRERMHELLFVEEMARYDLIARYNLTAKLQIAHSYILSPNSAAASTAKYSNNGELFASVNLCRELSEDTSEGRLILMHCNSVYLSLTSCREAKDAKRRVYEARIEDKGKDAIYLRLSAATVEELKLTPDSDVEVDIQFQLNRIPYCEWHYTLDKISDFGLIFPETYLEPNIPWSPSRQWSKTLDSRLNIKQKEAVNAITTPISIQLPPILVIGPFGTGKTFTLAQAMRELIKDRSHRILLCTHSNSAADLYIRDYLDRWVEEGVEEARPLRIYYTKRWVSTVHPSVQKYCLIKTEGTYRHFLPPTLADLSPRRVVVVTLSTSAYLSHVGVPRGFFTHILVDEAAQAIECETAAPLAVAGAETRVVLAGDHMQLGPDVFSPFARERELHVSLLERLYDRYPARFPCKILLCENYRAHESIVRFTSESFYDQKMVASGKQPRHADFYPLTFFTTRGEDVQDKNSTAFYNDSEVYEVVERVSELKRNWPSEWGSYTDQSIGVVTPYADQVFRIRSELRKRRVDNVGVERVLNVQGKQFRCVVLSTVRTRKTCRVEASRSEVDYGFLSNAKLLNTAITRAQSLVAVVGDPIALCSLGRCSKVWERFVQICNDNGSLFGITWTQLKLQLDGIELKKIYTLNPLAPEFIPRRYKELRVVQPPSEPTILDIPSKEPPQPVAAPPPPPPPTTLVSQLPPPVISPYPLQDLRFFPQLLYPQQPRPFLFNLIPPPLTNGYARPPPIVDPAAMVARLRQPLRTNKSVAVASTARAQNAGDLGLTVGRAGVQQVSSNKLIQFMNNVHFPEAHVLNDCVNLLPQSMSLADMLLQPASIQERWYDYLKATSGIEAAEKFKYLLHTTNQKGSKPSDGALFDRSTPSDSPTFCWYDSPTNQINFDKPVYMTERTPGVVVATRNGRLERRADEALANLSVVDDSDVDEVFRAFTRKGDAISANGDAQQRGVAVPKFYKYFQ